MKLTFKKAEVLPLIEHTEKAERHQDANKGLWLIKRDGVYLQSSGLPRMKAGKNDDYLVFAKKHGETGEDPAGETWMHHINGAWLQMIKGLKTETFTIIVRGGTMKFASGDCPDPVTKKAGGERDKLNGYWITRHEGAGGVSWLVSTDRKGKNVKHKTVIGREEAERWVEANLRSKRKAPARESSTPVGFISLATIAGELKLDARKARIILRKSGTKCPDYGWAWDPKDVQGIKDLLTTPIKRKKPVAKKKPVVKKKAKRKRPHQYSNKTPRRRK